jgi:hypothetical protein
MPNTRRAACASKARILCLSETDAECGTQHAPPHTKVKHNAPAPLAQSNDVAWVNRAA